MKLNLNNETDVFKLAQIAGLQNPKSVTAVVSGYISEKTDYDENCIITVAKVLLPDSYRGNPSLFAAKVLEKLRGDWSDSSGYQTPNRRTHVTIEILHVGKPLHARRAHPSPSIKQIIKQWLNLNLPRARRLSIPIAAIPAFYASHPEQLTYAIKRETETPIKIRRATAHWIIKRA